MDTNSIITTTESGPTGVVSDFINENMSEVLADCSEDLELAVALPPKLVFDSVEFLNNLKKQFDETLTYEKKIQILTLLPKTWNTQDIRTYFDASHRMIKKAREVSMENGILPTLDAKKGN